MSASVLHPQVHPENDLAIASSQVWNLPRGFSFGRLHACLKLNQGYFRGCLPSHPDVNLRSTRPNRSDDPSSISIRAPENFKEEAPSHCEGHLDRLAILFHHILLVIVSRAPVREAHIFCAYQATGQQSPFEFSSIASFVHAILA